MGFNILLLPLESLRHLAEIEQGWPSACKKQKLKQHVFNLCGKTRKILLTVGVLRWRRNVPNRCRIRRYYSIDCRTQLWRHISVYSSTFLSRERRFFLSSGSFSPDGWEKLYATWRTNLILNSRRSTFGLISREGPCAKQFQQKPRHTKITSYRRTTVGCSSQRRTLCKVVNWTVVSPKRKKARSLSSRNSWIQAHSWFGRWISRVRFAPASVF